MIAIPLTKKLSWRKPPVVTIGLILINIFIFAVFQHSDDRRWGEAAVFYFESGLADLEVGIYRLYIENRNEPSLEGDAASQAVAPEERRVYYPKISQDAAFLRKLHDGKVISEQDPRFVKWRQLRSAYEEKMQKVVSVRYGFRPAYPRAVTWLTCMFLHGSWSHLLGNMVFLWLVGCLIEYGCRHLIFPVVYLLGGAAGTGLFWLLNMESTAPLVGASGAIAGIMGAFTVFYGTKKVRIFLNLGFYFNYLKFPAVVLLPVWMGNELFQMLFNQWSPVAYAAHLGGLAGGALMAWIARLIPNLIDRDAFEAVQDDPAAPLLESALQHMGNLDFGKARILMEQVLAHTPDDAAVWLHLYTIDRQDPESPQFHRTAQKAMDLLCQQPAGSRKACSLFREYLQIARPPRLSPDLYIRISNAFIAVGELKEARRIIFTLLKKAPALPHLPTAVLKLAMAYRQGGDPEGFQECLRTLKEHFPLSNETHMAMQQVSRSGT